jgi:hypothetical protein
MADLLNKGYGNRTDGTRKGTGWLGELKRPDGAVSTEISVQFDDVNGGKEIPLIVPTLDKDEVNTLLSLDPKDKDFYKKLPKSILNKAIEHAEFRIQNNSSPYAD